MKKKTFKTIELIRGIKAYYNRLYLKRHEDDYYNPNPKGGHANYSLAYCDDKKNLVPCDRDGCVSCNVGANCPSLNDRDKYLNFSPQRIVSILEKWPDSEKILKYRNPIFVNSEEYQNVIESYNDWISMSREQRVSEIKDIKIFRSRLEKLSREYDMISSTLDTSTSIDEDN